MEWKDHSFHFTGPQSLFFTHEYSGPDPEGSVIKKLPFRIGCILSYTLRWCGEFNYLVIKQLNLNKKVLIKKNLRESIKVGETEHAQSSFWANFKTLIFHLVVWSRTPVSQKTIWISNLLRIFSNRVGR